MFIKKLTHKDKIGVICPSSYADMNTPRLKNFEKIIKQLGFKLEYGASCFARDGYLAGTDQQRIDDIHEMFSNPQIKAIICYKGGYGASRIVDKLNYQLIKNNPKLFIGFSDITVLLNAIYQQTNIPTIHGNMGIVLGRDNIDEISLEDFKLILSMNTKDRLLESKDSQSLGNGIVQGKLVGGNLSLIACLVGTKYDVDFRDKIVFFEEVSEAPYRIDRMFSQLRLAGKLEQAKGFVFGHFTNCDHQDNTQSIDHLIQEYFQDLEKPIIKNFNSGHDLPFLNLPLGLTIELDTNKKSIKIIEELYEKS